MPIALVSNENIYPSFERRVTRSMSGAHQASFTDLTQSTSSSSSVTPHKQVLQRVHDTAVSNFPTPKKYYDVAVNKKQKIQVQLTPNAKKEDAIYKFRQKSTGKSYIGMASLVQKRVSSWMTAVNNPECEAAQALLAQEIRKNPKDFEFGIIVSKQELQASGNNLKSLGEIEALYIEYYKQKAPLFNKRKGGGGGTKKIRTTQTKSQAEVSKKVRAIYHTPKKSYPLDANTYKVLLTPSAKGDLYIIKRVEKLTGNAAKIKRYVGRTEREVKKRLGEHSHYTRHSEKIRHQKSELYQDMHTFPEQFEIKVLDSNQLGIDDIDMLETGLIEFFENQDPTSNNAVYNTYAGGNGSHAARPPARKLFT